MQKHEIAQHRLINQHVAGPTHATVKQLIDWMGAMQAQDYAMTKWALGIRLPGSTEAMIDDAIDKGDVIRTHVLRPTWHLVSPDDIRWMLALTAPQIRSSMRARDHELELTAPLLRKTRTIIEKALSGGTHRTREDLLSLLHKAKIATDENRASHILLHAELDGVICSGASKGGKKTYALLSDRVRECAVLPRDEALALLARKYFLSHGPATARDFFWWSNLRAADARRAVEMVRKSLSEETIDGETYLCADAGTLPRTHGATVHLLPAYDEFLISYKNRTAALAVEHHSKAFSSNGIFRPVIVMDGRVRGLWKRTINKEAVAIEAELFGGAAEGDMKLITKAAGAFAHFLGKRSFIHHTTP